MNIRTAIIEDVEAIALLHAESWRTTYRGMFKEEFLNQHVFQDRKDVWHQRFTKPQENQIVLVVEQGQKLCGFACAFGNEDHRWGTLLDNLHVCSTRRRQGIGKRLLIEIARWSNQRYPYTGLHLAVLESNVLARRFYKALGATNQESQLWEPPGGGVVKEFIYAWHNFDSLLSDQV